MSDEKMPRCFVIMPISDQPGYPEGHFTKVYNQIFREAIKDAGYEPYRVDEDNICDSIILKIFDGIQNCDLALCDLSSRNPNVLYELGLRQAYDKTVVLVQDEKTERIFDVGGINTISYNSNRLYESVIEAREKITQALKDAKNGKGYSLVKIVKSNAANFPEGDLPENEKTQIMLQRIMFELNQIKQEKKYDDRISDEYIKMERLNDKGYILTKKIEDEVRDLEREILMLDECSTIVSNSKLKQLGNKINNLEVVVNSLGFDMDRKIAFIRMIERAKELLVDYTKNRLDLKQNT